MSNWIKIVVPVSAVAVLLTVLAIGVGSSVSYAAKPATNPGPAELACNVGTDGSGRVRAGDSDSYEIRFCSDPTEFLVAAVIWNGKVSSEKDLALLVTSPTGMEYFVDHQNTTIESFWVGPNLPEGVWTIDVINMGSQNVKYDLSVAFG